MTDLFLPNAQSALDLTISGSIGNFEVTTRSSTARKAIPVRYLSSHIGLATAGDHEEKLLSRMAPVREVFNLNELDFDQIMQRDIDDDRVANDLIPYLLDDAGALGLVKFFPPIIIAILSTDSRGRPSNLYPAVEQLSVPVPNQSVKWESFRSGHIGSEAFEFRQLQKPDGQVDPHNYATLKLNTQKCKLAIIDGQHRAMALIALYRNLKGWPEKTSQYRDYYRRWSPSRIGEYDFSNVRLPVVFCTFPSLNESDIETPATVPQACRAVFLALNKNAKKVTNARTHLLDDKDLVASFMRAFLSEVKAADANSDLALRLWNIELDAEDDKVPLTNTVALTGVMHIYNLLERLMLQDGVVRGLHPKRSNTWKLTRLDSLWRRLEAGDVLGEDIAETARRNNLDGESESKLVKLFLNSYGRMLLRCFDEFWPYHVHNSAAIAHEHKLRNSAKGFHSLLFEGQSQARVFKNFINRMKAIKSDYKDSRRSVPPDIDELLKDFQTKNNALEDEAKAFRVERKERFLENVPGWLRSPDTADSAVGKLYRDNFTTAAFQAGFIIAFFSIVESVSDARESNGDARVSRESMNSLLTEYLECLNQFFRPTSEASLKNIIRVLSGSPTFDKSAKSIEIAKSRTLRKILVPGELNPKEWARLRYIFLELWQSQDREIADTIRRDVAECRRQAFQRLRSHAEAEYAEEHGIQTSAIEPKVKTKLEASCFKDLQAALKPLGSSLRPEDVSSIKTESK